MSQDQISRKISAILDACKDTGWNEEALFAAELFAEAQPEANIDLAKAIARRSPHQWWRLLNPVLSRMPEGDWEPLVNFALGEVAVRHNNWAAHGLILEASNQAPATLVPNLERFFWHQVETATHISTVPWRGSGTASLDFLRGLIATSDQSRIRSAAWQAMLETRDTTMIREALHLHRTTAIFLDEPTPYDDYSYDLAPLGFDASGPEVRHLVPEKSYHLIFPRSAFAGLTRTPRVRWDDSDWPAAPRRSHPTWHLKPSPELPPMRFGGYSRSSRCPRCDGRLHRYITLDPIPSGLGITGLPRLELATCLTCLGPSASTTYASHDAEGWAESMDELYDVRHDEELGPLLELDVLLAPTPPRWCFQENSPLNNGEENLNRLGGEARWNTGPMPDDRLCKICGQAMIALMQLDSFIPALDGTEWWWVTRGACVVFWCDDCKVSGYYLDQTR